MTTTTPGLDAQSLQDGTADDVTWFRAWVSSWGGVMTYIGIFLLAVLFPSGGLPAGLWGRVVRLTLFLSLSGVVLRAVAPTIGYGLVTMALFALFAVVNLGAQRLLSPFVRGDTIAVAMFTLDVAATFSPLRSRVQRAVDRRFNRVRYDQERTIDAFARGLRQDFDVDRVLAHVQGTVQAAVEPRAVGVWRRREGTS